MLLQRDFALSSRVPNRTMPVKKERGPAAPAVSPAQRASFDHFPCDLSAPLPVVSPSNTMAITYVMLKMVFCCVLWGETVWPV